MPSVLYHATHADFESFDEAFAGERTDSHANSALGIWFATTPDWISGFGRRIIEAEIELGSSYPMGIGQLASLSRKFEPRAGTDTTPEEDRRAQTDRWRSLRAELLARGFDSVAIVETTEQVMMHVVLDTRSIVAIRDLEAAPGPAP